jgi:hypothetical protein
MTVSSTPPAPPGSRRELELQHRRPAVNPYLSGSNPFGRMAVPDTAPRLNERWTTVYTRGWERSIRDVRTEITYHTPLTQRYRIRSWNPAGWTSYVNVNGSSTIAPG